MTTARLGSVLMWGNDNVATTTTTRFLTPGYDNVVAPTVTVQWRIPRDGLLRNMRVRHNIVGASVNLIVYTLRVNAVATALSVSLAANATDGSNTATVVSVVAGDLLDVIVTKAIALGGGDPSDVVAVMEFV